MENRATFRFDSYRINHAVLNFKEMQNNVQEELALHFKAAGIYFQDKGVYKLTLLFSASAENKTPMIEIDSEAIFQFKDIVAFENIPEYFYANSIAILFPYLRSFVSTLSLQANTAPMILPTMNLIGLNDELKRNTILQ